MIQNYWNDFLEHTEQKNDAKCAGIVCFGMDAQSCEAAVCKILSGEMRCRIYPAEGYRKALSGEAKMGELNVVTDWKGAPCAVIETTKVQFLPAHELTDEICAMEGFCANLAEWREKQLPLIKTEVEELGAEFGEDTLLCIEEFKTVYPLS